MSALSSSSSGTAAETLPGGVKRKLEPDDDYDAWSFVI